MANETVTLIQTLVSALLDIPQLVLPDGAQKYEIRVVKILWPTNAQVKLTLEVSNNGGVDWKFAGSVTDDGTRANDCFFQFDLGMNPLTQRKRRVPGNTLIRGKIETNMALLMIPSITTWDDGTPSDPVQISGPGGVKTKDP